MATGWDGKMDFEREWNVDAAADRQQAPEPELAALAARVKGHPIQPGSMRTVTPGPDGTVVLPAGTDINHIEVDGRNLVVTLPDGTQMVILDGAVVVPRIVVGDVEIPPVNLAALLIGEEPQPAAGPARSSGGNFLAADGDVGDLHGLGDLLPPTELSFSQPEEREILPIAPNDAPAVTIVTPNQPAGAISATAGVSEAGLPARGEEPAGTAAASDSERTSGTIQITANDGLAGVTINGTLISTVGQAVMTPLGVLTITSIAPDAIGYSYVLSDNVVGTPPAEVLTVVVTDSDGDQATATLTISIADDAPQAHNDTDLVAAGTYGPETGNVVTGAGTTSGAAGADVSGADGFASSGAVVGVAAGANGAALDNANTVGHAIQGLYGVLTLNGDGSYSYVRSAGTPGGVSDNFTYTVRDGDGDLSSATLTINIGDSGAVITSIPTSGAGTVVDEAGLGIENRPGESPGSDAPATIETTNGTITYVAPDMPATVTINGVTVTAVGQQIAGASGTLIITGIAPGSINYSYTVNDNTSGDDVTDKFTVVVTDVDGDASAPGTLVITIKDDVPTAHDDAGTQTAENATIVINAFTNDVFGADGVDIHNATTPKVTIVSGPALGGVSYDPVTGLFTFTPAAGQEGTASFIYQIEDGDGDTSQATVTVTLLPDSTPTILIAESSDTLVDEAALNPNGSNAASTAETATGVLVITTGNDTVGTLFVNNVDVTNGGTVKGAFGTLTITGSPAAGYAYSYTLETNSSGNGTHDDFAITVTDSDGDPAATTLTIAIIDDKPQALPDTDTVAAGSFAAETGNVITGADTTSGTAGADVLGADGAGAHVSFGGSIVGGVFVPGSGQGVPSGASAVIHGQYGDLTLFSNGDYSYTRFTDTPGGVEDKFVYVLADNDGSTSPATLTISIGDSTPTVSSPAAGGDTTTVYEAGLPARPGESEGSGEQTAPGPNGDPREAVSGTVNFHSADGIQSLTVGGVTLNPSLFPQTVVDNGTGTLVIAGGSYDDLTGDGSFTYTYTLKDNTTGDGTSVSFDIVLTDQDGDPASSSLTIAIVDDVPHAIDDAGGVVTEDGAVGMLSGNVLTNDVQGADSPSSFVGWGADTAAIAELNTYGTLTQNSDGTWSYVLDNSRAATQALGASFSKDFTLNYTMQDADGDPSSAKLVITVHGSADDATVTTAAPTGPDNTVYEAGLPTGSLHDGSHATTGSFTVTATDGIANIVVGGTTFTLAQMQAFGTTNGVVNTGEGTLRLTGFNSATGVVNYSYTLAATIDNDSYAGATPTAFDNTVLLTVNSVAGSIGSDELVVRIVDDSPHAVDDAGGTVTEDGAGSLSGNVLTNDVAGADQPKSFVAWSATDIAAVAALNTYGTLTQNANGTWSYVLDNSRAATQALGSAFNQDFTLNYTMQDADGDPSSAKLVITVKGAADSATVTTAAATGPDSTVYEAGLPTGSLHNGSHVAVGTFTATATDGIANIVVGGTTFTLAQMQAFGTTNGVVNTGEGTLRLTGYNAGTGAVSYSYTLNATIDNDSYAGATPANFDDSVALVVNGIGGTTASDTLVVRIVDDVPTLGTVQNQQTDNNVATAPAIGTLHYVSGADGTGSIVISANTSSITVGGQAVVTSQNGNVLTGYVDADHSGGFNAGDTTVFTLTVNPSAGTSGQYVFDLVTKLDPTVTDVPIGQGSAFGAGPSNEIVVTDKTTSQQLVYVTGWAPTGGFTPAEIAAWEATGAVTATQTNNVNGSTQGWGLANNNFDAGEFLRFDFGPLADYDGAGGYTPPNTYNIVNASYATFSFFNFGANEQIIFVAHYTDGTRQVFEINGPDEDNQQKISAPAGALIDWIDVYQSSGEMKLNLTNVGVASSSIDKTIPFTLQFTDNDGDTTATQNFSVHVKDGLTPATPAAPIAIDLDGDGLEFLSLAAGVSHDYGTGAVNTAWVSANDGLLVHTVGGAYDTVFSDDAPGATSDLEGLRLAYDSNGDGVFDAKDAAFAEFGVWQDVNGNGHVDAGEVKTLTAAGIAVIDLTSDGKSYVAANGDVTVLGEASFMRTDGSKGTIGDAVFTTAPKGSELRSDSTTSSGINQALVAASLVAVVGAAETQDEKQPSPTSTETTPVVPEETAPVSATTSEPVTSDETKILSEASNDKSARSAEQPVQQASHGSDEPAPDHAALADHGASSVPAPTATAQADQPTLGDHQTLLAQSISLPSFEGNAAAALAAAQASANANPAAAEVVREALGAHDAPHIDTLLAALPGGEHPVVPVLFNPVAAEPVDLGHMAAAAAVFEAAIAAHEAMAVAHG
jgi:VCBS repeat-containing protein